MWLILLTSKLYSMMFVCMQAVHIFHLRHWVAVFGLTVDRGLRHTCIDILIHLVNCALKCKSKVPAVFITDRNEERKVRKQDLALVNVNTECFQ